MSVWWKRVAPALGLFFLAPWIAEFLLGDISISHLPILLVMAPLYGGGALLVREVTRRTGRGWPTLLLLALAYAVIEEGLAIQTLFNPDYAGAHLLRRAWIPGLGIGGWWTLFVLTLHTVWSVGTSVALVEALARGRRTRPWLGNVGLGVVAALYLLGCLMVYRFTFAQYHFSAHASQLGGAAVAALLLIVAALRFPRRAATQEGRAPGVWTVAGAAFVASGAIVGLAHVDILPGWVTVTLYLLDYALMIGLVSRWCRTTSWSDTHRTALAGGALMTYAWVGFVQRPLVGQAGWIDLAGNALFALMALWLAVASVRAATLSDDRA